MSVNHYESSNESVKEQDFAEDVPKINVVQSMRLMKMAKTMTNAAPMMEVKKTVLFTFFKAPKDM